MTRPTAARPTTSPVSRMSSARVRKTWVVGSMGGPRVEVLLARAVVVPRVLVLWKLLRYTFLFTNPSKNLPLWFLVWL